MENLIGKFIMSMAQLIVEGVKKAGALLTAGYAAMAYPPAVGIAIPGVNAGYRTPHDEYGTAIGKNLSSNVSYFEVLKAFFASACGWRSQEGGRNSAIAQKKRWAIRLFLWARVVSVEA
ncbi:MAG: DUF3854 domain-containing protein [Nostoc sp.]|uniref:DUF3854 domain-containing protein n=1 Tax=Nostoc sp. TaxID=1180 RepID=UPI002FFA0C88